MAFLHPVATALPRNVMPQAELRAVADAVIPESPGKAGILEVFDNARIDKRALACPVEWYLEPHGHKDRAQVFHTVGLDLVEAAAKGAMANAKMQPSEIDAMLLVSTTGLATPSLDARVMNRIGFRSDVRRMPVWGLGCAGGVGGVNRAAEWAQATNGNVLLVCVELCSLLFDIEKAIRPGAGGPDKKAVISASLFGDGAAGLVVSATDQPKGGLRYVAGSSHLFPETERVMGWDVEDHNLDVVLSPKIPDIVRQNAAGLVEPFLARHNAGKRPDHWVLHPGGAKVIDAYRDALGLSSQDLRHTDGVLRSFGNMSSPTVLFALQTAQQQIRPGESAMLSALGPGFASELALVRA